MRIKAINKEMLKRVQNYFDSPKKEEKGVSYYWCAERNEFGQIVVVARKFSDEEYNNLKGKLILYTGL